MSDPLVRPATPQPVRHRWIDVDEAPRIRCEARRRDARVLVVGRDAAARAALATFLADAGFGEVLAATAPDRPTQGRPVSLALVADAETPDDDLEALAEVRAALADAAFAPIVLVTREPDPRFHRAALRHGAADVEVAPADLDLLAATLDRWLETRERVLDAAASHDHDGDPAADEATLARHRIDRLHQVAALRDHDLAERGAQVARLAAELAQRLGWPAARSRALRHAALVYDVGMLALPDALLHPHEPLGADQHARLRTHPGLGQALLEAVPGPLGSLARNAARSHHERWDGRGYPDRLQGEAIPIEARIVAVADAYDARRRRRPDRGPRAAAVAYQEIVEDAGTAFEPAIVDAFRRWFQQEDGEDDRPLACP
jgi:putative two-component system response regulator